MGKLDNPDYIKQFINHLGQSLVEDLKDSIPDHLEKLIDIRFKGIKEGMETLGRIESTQRDQANMLENLQLSYKHLNDEFETFRRKSQNLPEQIATAASDTLEEKTSEMQNAVLDAVSSQLEQIPTKPTKPIKKKKFSWKFWRR